MAVFGAASESFARQNVNCTIAESITMFQDVMDAAKAKNVKVRGYVSTVVDCPYEGKIKPSAVAKVTEQLFNMGCYEVSLVDTIGLGTPETISAMLKEVLNVAPLDKFAVHCHDTYDQGLPNILTSLEFGVSIVDAFVSGLGASGNVNIVDISPKTVLKLGYKADVLNGIDKKGGVLYPVLNGPNNKTGVDPQKLVNFADIMKKNASGVSYDASVMKSAKDMMVCIISKVR